MTRRYRFHSGITTNSFAERGINDIGLVASELTLAEVFKSAGYRTGMIGKLHLGQRIAAARASCMA